MANSNTSAVQLGEAYKNCAATAASMGYSVEDATAALMTMANAGVKGGEAGTALNTIMTRLATDTKACASELAQYGVEVYDSTGKLQSLSSILQGVSAVWDTLTDQQQANLAKIIAGTNQYSSFMTIIAGCGQAAEESGQSFLDYAAALEDCSGSAGEMAETMLDNLNGKMTLLNSAFDTLKIAVGEQLSPAFEGLAESGADVLTWAAELVETCPALVGLIGAVAAGMGVLTAAVTGYALATKVAIPLMTAFSAALTATPIGIAAVALTALVAGVGAFAIATAGAEDAVSSLTDSLNESRQAYQENAAALEQQGDAQAAAAAATERMTGLMQEQAAISEALAAARQTLEEAERGLAAAGQNAAAGFDNAADQLDYYRQQTALARQDVEALEQALADNEAELDALEDAYGDGRAAIQHHRKEVEASTAAVAESVDQFTALSGVLDETKDRYQLLSSAQQETNETGYVSLTTLTKLLDKYPDLLGYLEQVEGGYRLAGGALEDYMTAQRAQYQMIYDSAASAAQSAVDAEALKAAGYDATTMSIKAQLEAMMQLYAAQVSLARSGALEQYGNDVTGRQLASQDSAVRAAESRLLAVQNALTALSAAETRLSAFDGAAGTLGRSGSSSQKSSSSSSSSKKDTKQSALDELEDWLDDMEHAIYLHTRNNGGAEALVEMYRDMQAKVHQVADEYRVQGYDETSDEIQKLQRLWWDYSDEIGDLYDEMYERDLSALEDALNAGEITWDEYLDGRLTAQNKYLGENSQAWADAEAQRLESARKHMEELRQANENAYSDLLADQKYYLDMGLISQEEYFRKMAELRDTYLEENSEKWRQANVAIYQFQQQQQEQALQAIEDAYNEQVKALEAGLKEAQNAEKEAYAARKQEAKDAYDAKKQAIKDELALEKERLNGIIDGINQEIQARRELREDEDLDGAIAQAQKRLDAARAQLAYARSAGDQAEWEKEIVRLEQALAEAVQNKEDTEFYRAKELEKEEVQGQISEAEKKADAALSAAEQAYNAELERLEAEYQANLARLEAEYQANLARLEAAQREAAGALQGSGGGGSSGGGAGGERVYSDEVLGIARAQGVDTNVAYDMWRANQRNVGDPTAAYYYGAELAGQIAAEREAAAQLASASAGLAQVTQSLNQTVNNTSNSASVVINHAAALTEGQVARAVEKAVERLGR